MSERQRVMNHLHNRIVAAFNSDNESAVDLNNFLNGLELMTDEEYDAVYGEDFAKVGD